MSAQGKQNEWKTLRRIEYDGELESCRRCGAVPQLYVIQPAGIHVKILTLKTEAFVAARCACGATGPLKPTGIDLFGMYIDEDRAALRAANAWNFEQRNG